MNDGQSFYTSGGTLSRVARSYVTRRADEDLLRHLRNGDFCYVLTSRQMGKSSLMVRTAFTLRQEDVRVAILDLTRIGQNVTLEQWYDGMLMRLGSELNLEDELDAYWMSERVSRIGPMQRFMGALREIALPAVKGKLVIFIDEIDAVKSLPFSSDEFFAGIRECYNSRVGDADFRRLSFCLLGVAQPSDLISNAQITPFNIGHRIELTDFNEQEAQPLLEGLTEKSASPKDAKKTLHRILYWTGGHPYLTQMLCETLVHLDKQLTPADVDVICADLFLSTRSREQQDNLIFVRDRVLSARENRAAILDLYLRVLRGEKVRDDDSNTTIDPLRLSGLLIVSKGYLKVRNRIYATVFDQKWVGINMPDAEVRRQKAAFRRGVARAFAVSLPILALIALLCVFAVREARKAVIISYFASTNSAQEAFNVGDYLTGKKITDDWNPERIDHGLWTHVQHSWQGHEALEHSVAMSFLLGEDNPAGSSNLQRQFIDANDPKPTTGCGAELSVSTAMFGKVPLIAAAGSDSSVQIWRSDTRTPFASLQLNSIGADGSVQVGPLRPCSDLKVESSSLPGITSISFSPDGSKLAIATGSWSKLRNPGSVLVWDMRHPQDAPRVITRPQFMAPTDWVEFAQDGKDQYLAASSEDATAKVWKFVADNPVLVANVNPQGLQAPDGGKVGGGGANVVALSSSLSHWMAIGYGDGYLVIYDYQHPDATKPLYVGRANVSGVMSLTFLDQKIANQDARRVRLAVGSRDGDLILMDPQELIDSYNKPDGSPEKLAAARDAIKLTERPGQGVLQGLTVGYNKDHTKAWLLTSGSDNTVQFWAILPNFHVLTTLRGHEAGVHAAAFCPTENDSAADSGCIVSASSDKNVRMWDHPFRARTESGEHTHIIGRGLTFPGQQTLGVAFTGSHDEKLITAVGASTEYGSDDAEVVASWEYGANSSKSLQEFSPDKGVKPSPLLAFGVSPDGRFLVSTSRSRQLAFVDLVKPPGYRESQDVHVTLDTKIEIRCLGADGNVLAYDLNDSKHGCLPNQSDYLVIGTADRTDIPDSEYGQAKGLCLWHIHIDDSNSSKQHFVLQKDIRNPCVSPTSLAPSADWTPPPDGFRLLARNVGMFDVSADGRKFVASLDSLDVGDKTIVEIWQTHDLLKYGLPVVKSKYFGSQFAYMRFSPDGAHIAATTIGADLYYWQTDETNSVHALESVTNVDMGTPVPDSVESRSSLSSSGRVLAFSPISGQTLAIGMSDGRIVLWDTVYRSTIMAIRQHRGSILGLAFSADEKTLASSGNDGLVHIMQARK